MASRSIAALAACAAAAVLTLFAPDAAQARSFNNPHVDGKRLDGCYSWPGPCRTRTAANAFCRRKGYERASDWEASNQFGAYQTYRLGDGGVCTASCTVMTYVRCTGEDEGDDDE